MAKRCLIALLVGANLLLLACLVLTAYSPPLAVAEEQVAEEQLADEQGQYILVAAEAGVSNDAIYLLDTRHKLLHLFRSNYPRAVGHPVRVAYMDTRDLKRDFPKSRPDRKKAEDDKKAEP